MAFCTVTLMGHVSDSFGEAAGNSRRLASALVSHGDAAALQRGAREGFPRGIRLRLRRLRVTFLLGPTAPKALPVLAYLEFQNPDIMNRCVAMALNGVMAVVTTAAAAAYFAVLRREERDR